MKTNNAELVYIITFRYRTITRMMMIMMSGELVMFMSYDHQINQLKNICFM